MSWWTYREVVTAADVLEDGSCLIGVLRWIQHKGLISGKAAEFREPVIIQAARADGKCCGYGYGYDLGCGYDGYGDGYDGCGYGCGNGHGNGEGYGNGDGYGNGCGDGFGSGDGLGCVSVGGQ